MATGDVEYDVSNDETVKKLGEMMSEYLSFKKIEREVSCTLFSISDDF
jgi:hypothetical protein